MNRQKSNGRENGIGLNVSENIYMKYEHQKCFWIDINVRILDFPIRFDSIRFEIQSLWIARPTNCVFGWMFCSCCDGLLYKIFCYYICLFCVMDIFVYTIQYMLFGLMQILINGKPHFITEFSIVSICKQNMILSRSGGIKCSTSLLSHVSKEFVYCFEKKKK